MKLKPTVYFVLLALFAAGCGGSSSTEDDETDVARVATTLPTTTTLPSGPTGVTPPPGPTGAQPVACNANNPEEFYEAYVSGTDRYQTGYKSVGQTQFGRPIIADQFLRVSVEPAGSGGSQTYEVMAVRVTLAKNGVALASKDIPVQSGGSSYKSGVQVGAKSDPTIANFSSYLNCSSTDPATCGYSIRVSQIQTNWTCKTGCTTSFYACYSWAYYGYSCYWTWDYNSQTYACCPDNSLYTCQTMKCGVGYDTGTARPSWNLYLRVETDNSRCIPL